MDKHDNVIEIENTLKELVMNERKFLHDISNHIVVAHGMSTFVYKALKSNPAVEPKEIERLEKAIEALNKMTTQLKERRSLLHELS